MDEEYEWCANCHYILCQLKECKHKDHREGYAVKSKRFRTIVRVCSTKCEEELKDGS